MSNPQERASAVLLCDVFDFDLSGMYCGPQRTRVREAQRVKYVPHLSLAYVYRNRIEELITTITEANQEAQTRLKELMGSQQDLDEYAKRQIEVLDETVEKLMELLQVEQEKVKEEFKTAVGVESNQLAEEIKKYVEAQEELQEKNVELGNILDSLGTFAFYLWT
jgi:hypothetical protein